MMYVIIFFKFWADDTYTHALFWVVLKKNKIWVIILNFLKV